MIRSSWRRRRARRRRGFKLRDLFVAQLCLGVVFALGVLLLRPALDSARRQGCLSNLRQLSLAVNNYEMAHRRFPIVSDSTGSLQLARPGTVGIELAESAGYSWLVQVLPYSNEALLYEDLRVASENFTLRPFENVSDRQGNHFATRKLPSLSCPTFRGSEHVQNDQGSEYDKFTQQLALSNYVAISGTHANRDSSINDNGVIVSRAAGVHTVDGNGIRMKDIGDGISTTFLLAESVEPIYAAWIDGQSNWVVGHASGDLGPNDDRGFPTAKRTMLGRGAKPGITGSAYSSVALPASWPGKLPRQWGASSHHRNVVIHTFADGHAVAISTNVNPTHYFWTITRCSGDPGYHDF